MSKDKPFVCPICGSTKYTTRQKQMGGSNFYTLKGYECDSCSVRFGDPKKFGKHRTELPFKSLPKN